MRADSRALLQLLLERDQSYDDLAGILGSDRDEVRRRAREALAELGGSEPDPELTDYLLGQADPIARADAVRKLQDVPEALTLAARLLDELRALAPDAELPHLPEGRARGAEVSSETDAEHSGEGLTRRQRLVLLALVIGAGVVIGVVALVGGVFEGDEEPAAEPASSADGPANEDAVRVELEPQGSSDASGEAIFGLATADQLFLDLSVDGLEAPSAEQTYVIWLLLTPEQGYPVSPIEVDDKGVFSDRFPIPGFAVPIAGRARFLDVALVDRGVLQAQVDKFAQGLNQGGQAELPVLRYEGESVLRGEIPATGGPALLGEG